MHAEAQMVLVQVSMTTELERSERKNDSEQFGGRKMRYEYEKACMEAGLSEEKTKEIRKFFDAESKRLKRQRKIRERHEIEVFSFEQVKDDFGWGADKSSAEKDDFNLEEMVTTGLMLKQLRGLLAEMEEEDRNFLLALYGYGKYGAECHVAEMYGWSRSKVRYKKANLLMILRERMGVKNNKKL